MFGLSTELSIILLLCLVAACLFEFINGFHDTANAVATVIYTNAMKPGFAVVWSGIWNFIGVNVGGIAVAVAIINLLPVEAVVDANIYHGMSMIMALILTAIIWNLGTWYFGIPCSSSHTLIGSIFGVGIAYMLLPGSDSVALNWKKVEDAVLSLLISPVFGFFLALFLMFILRKTVKNKQIFKEPSPKKAPPLWIRTILIFTSTSVSLSHGMNDGQKGVGLIMMILIAFAPLKFAVDLSQNPQTLHKNVTIVHELVLKVDTTSFSETEKKSITKVALQLDSMQSILSGITNFDSLRGSSTFELRKDILLIAKSITKIEEAHKAKGDLMGLKNTEIASLNVNLQHMRNFTEYAPWWVILMIALSLGLGTMVGWKRIVVTIGEKIGKSHLTYSQGASSNLVAASTIIASSWAGLPVSTTHVLSSGIAGSMVAGGGLKNLQTKTIINIAIAWLITLPVTILLSGAIFLIFRMIFT
jgi:phosphate/sulfate permease